ncbi:probable protein arginine N-methyltransferase 6 isoform X3 [Cynara cardunculus var. scolymus]|uniref:Protein arginine N-methyltransferase n=1 Tax=Cynara cardunculus var. scolymus TaxID=59895 RepID=A0A124SDM4_CYNCS|nr:probable protein arginine N-methyltransferase 6 isoform X3 [Cynara cardunculus var. scolymus]KVH97417.1 Protein arginine N-methyltransferase [Cynara cardunculus var. scolymus]
MEGMSRSPPAGSYSNGHHHKQQGGGTTTQRDHFRSRKSRQTGGRVPSGQQETEAPPCTDFDKAYFQSYSHVGIHEEMIKDRVRTETYRTAILQHQRHIEGKVVVDVGCGTGILSIFCAQAGAKRVYAVDASEIALQANEVVKANNLSDKVIVLHGRVEDVQIDEEVDVIISEWMGYMLLYESMLGSVIVARDRWLRPGGLILPSNAVLYMAPVTHPDRYAESIDFWRNVYGIDMSPILPLAKQCAFEEPSVETISGENVLTWPHVVKHVDCYTIRIQELESVTTKYKFQSMMRAPFHGFAFWFDVEFSGPANNDAPSAVEESPETTASVSHRRKRANPDEALVLSTAPEDPPTHWQQTMIYFYDPIDVEQDQVIEGSVTLTQSKENARFMNIHLEYASGGRSFVKECVLR